MSWLIVAGAIILGLLAGGAVLKVLVESPRRWLYLALILLVVLGVVAIARAASAQIHRWTSGDGTVLITNRKAPPPPPLRQRAGIDPISSWSHAGQWRKRARNGSEPPPVSAPPTTRAAGGAQEFRTSVKRAWFIVEYQKPVMSGSPATLDVLFYGPKPSPAQIEQVLRSCLDAAVVMDSSHDILATGFDGDDDTEPTLSTSRKYKYSGGVPDKLIYLSKSRKILTWKEYRAR